MTTTSTPAYKPQIKVEVSELTEQEFQFTVAVKTLLDAITTDDCRKLANGIRSISELPSAPHREGKCNIFFYFLILSP